MVTEVCPAYCSLEGGEGLPKAEVLVDVFIERSEYKFEDDVSAIERLKRRMIDLRDVGHIAQQADLKTALETASTGKYISSCCNNKTLILVAMASLHGKTILALDDLRTEVATLKDLTSGLQQQNHGNSSSGFDCDWKLTFTSQNGEN